MASNMTLVNGEQCFVCPVCLGVFEDATILPCGHTFCKKCLEEYDKNKNKDHIVCPTCRKRIRLGANRVSGLIPNYSLRGLEEKLRMNKQSADYCSLHSEIYKDIFCEDCGEFICLTCYLNFHKDHKIKKKEELQGCLRKKTEKLTEVGKPRKGQKQAVDYINNSITSLRRYRTANLDSDTLKAQHSQRIDLQKSPHKVIDERSIARLQQTASIEQGKTATGAKRKSKPPARKNVAVIPPPVRSKSLNIVRQVDVPVMVRCMAAAQSRDAVVVGYGGSIGPRVVLHGGHRPGSDRFAVSGEKRQHLKNEVGYVYGIAFLTDGRSVVSDGKEILRIYCTYRHGADMQYMCNRGVYLTKLCVDQDDNIYAVNGNPEIYIFHVSNPNPQRVIPTGDIKPHHICVTKTGALITRSMGINSLDTLTVFDREGRVGSSITASDNEEYLCATVDSQDRVLVARVRVRSDVFRLTRYTLQGTTLIQLVTFNELKLPRTVDTLCCYMTTLAPKLIAFANDQNLYFIELAV